MSDFDDSGFDEEDVEYFSELSDFDDTGKRPKFYRTPESTMTFENFQDMKVDELIQAYRDLRDQLGTDRKGYKAREAHMKGKMQTISMVLRDRGDVAGVESFRTDAGTAYRNVKVKYTVLDWPQTVEYVKQTNNFQILQKRVSPNAVREIETETGVMPPGIDKLVEVEFAVRSPTVRKSKP